MTVINRAEESGESAGSEAADHFAGAGKMIDLPNGAKRGKIALYQGTET